jgi:hypothetical protein
MKYTAVAMPFRRDVILRQTANSEKLVSEAPAGVRYRISYKNRL